MVFQTHPNTYKTNRKNIWRKELPDE